MMRFVLTDDYGHEVTVVLNASSPDEAAPIEYEGVASQCVPIEWDVIGSTDPRGRRLGAQTTPRALAFAMRSSPLLLRYRPRLTEGRILLDG